MPDKLNKAQKEVVRKMRTGLVGLYYSQIGEYAYWSNQRKARMFEIKALTNKNIITLNYPIYHLTDLGKTINIE